MAEIFVNKPDWTPAGVAPIPGVSRSVSPASPGRSPSPDATFFLGNQTSANFLQVANPSMLSANEFAVNHNQGMMFAAINGLQVAFMHFASSNKVPGGSSRLSKLGELSGDDVSVSGKLQTEHGDLVREVLQEFAEDLKTRNDRVMLDRLTPKAGARLNKQADAYKVLFLAAADKQIDAGTQAQTADDPAQSSADVTKATAAKDLMNKFTKEGLPIFFATIVKKHVAPTKDGAREGEGEGETAGENDAETIKLLQGDDLAGLIRDQINLFIEATKPDTMAMRKGTAKSVLQSKAFKKQVALKLAGNEEGTDDEPLLVTYLALLSAKALEGWFVDTVKASGYKTPQAAATTKKRNADTAAVDDDDDDDVSARPKSPIKKSRKAPASRGGAAEGGAAVSE
ncbi:hypothetical protein LTR17_024263 [Elasticomyces elasticus]|nr:hypothetical protein LTR17_024263 [Elasticomyces elasticus]